MASIPYEEHVCVCCGRRFYDFDHHTDNPNTEFLCPDCYEDQHGQWDLDDEYARSEAAYQDWLYYGDDY